MLQFLLLLCEPQDIQNMNFGKELILYSYQKPFIVLLLYTIFVLVAPSTGASPPSKEPQDCGKKSKKDARITDATPRDLFWYDPQEILSIEDQEALKAAQCSTIVDMMEEGPIQGNWNTDIMKPKSRFNIQGKHHQGSHALAIALYRDDPVKKQGSHKHELRIALSQRCEFGQEVWYSFSFRIDGKYPRGERDEGTRWVIGQWKENSDCSPFLAQRFDNGVFFITIQNNNERHLIATAKDYQYGKFEKEQEPKDYGLEATEIQSLKDAIINQEIAKFPFVADPLSFSKTKDVVILPTGNRLPDPRKDWVDMRYRVKGDRGGKGVVEVWANDEKIVRVTGKIGNDDVKGPTQYFKIGHYRGIDKKFMNSTIYFDRFKRGTKRDNVD